MVAPIFAPISKTSTSVPLGLKTLGAIAAASPIPLIGVGGINEERAGHCRQAGAAGVAAMGAVFLADDPVEAVRKLLGAWHDGATL